MLRVLSKVDMCHLVFCISTARIVFSKHPDQDRLDMKVDFNDEREGYEYHYSQNDLGILTKEKGIKQSRNDLACLLHKKSELT